MNKEQISNLIAHAKKDPAFFHKLVFEPEQAVKELKKKDPSGNEIILRANIQTIMQLLVSKTRGTKTVSNKPSYYDCTETCGKTCGETCIEVTCGPTGTIREMNDGYVKVW